MSAQMPFGVPPDGCTRCTAPQQAPEPWAVPPKAPRWPGIIIVIVMIGASVLLTVSGKAEAAAIAVEAVVTAAWAAVEIVRRLHFLPAVA